MESDRHGGRRLAARRVLGGSRRAHGDRDVVDPMTCPTCGALERCQAGESGVPECRDPDARDEARFPYRLAVEQRDASRLAYNVVKELYTNAGLRAEKAETEVTRLLSVLKTAREVLRSDDSDPVRVVKTGVVIDLVLGQEKPS